MCVANLCKWWRMSLDKCRHGKLQAMMHMIESYPFTKFTHNALLRIYDNKNAVRWLMKTASFKLGIPIPDPFSQSRDSGLRQEAQLLLGDRATRKHVKDS